MRGRNRRPRWGDEGQGGFEGLAFGVAVFVFGTLVITNAWGVIDAKAAATAAAREATRSFVESSAPSTTEALAEAEATAQDAIRGYGRDPQRMELVPEAAVLERCARVTMRVEYPVPFIVIPAIGRYGRGFTAVGRHSEVVDPFRSGLSDRSACGRDVRP